MQHHPAALRLWDALPIWEQLGLEVTLGGYAIPDWVRAQALDKLAPDELLRTIVGSPELAECSAKLAWVKAQTEHARGAAQAQHVGGAPATRRDKDNDVHTGAVAVDRCTPEPPLLWHLQEECAKRAQSGVWGGVVRSWP